MTDDRWTLPGRWTVVRNGLVRVAVVLAVTGSAMCTSSGGDDPIEQRDPSILSLLESSGELAIGDTVESQLQVTNHLVRTGRRVSAWHFEGVAGHNYSVSLRSTDFDPYLYVVGPSIRRVVVARGEDAYALTDDDSGDGLDSWICFTALATGSYKVVAGALEADTGRYAVAVNTLAQCPDTTE